MDEATEAAWNKAMDRILKDLDYLILATPSGELRNILTEANIWLLRASLGEFDESC
jgi:glycerol-3-phosphate dehydrogenase